MSECKISEHQFDNLDEGVYSCLKCGLTIDISDAHNDLNEQTWDAVVGASLDETQQ